MIILLFITSVNYFSSYLRCASMKHVDSYDTYRTAILMRIMQLYDRHNRYPAVESV